MIDLLSQIGSFNLLFKHAKRVNQKIKKSAKKRNKKSHICYPIDRLANLQNLILTRKFKFLGFDGIAIPKKDPKKKRPLSVPEPRDRIVYAAINELVKPKLFGFLSKAPSYGVLKRRGTHKAFEEVKKYLQEENEFILKVDIHNFFNEIDKKKLALYLNDEIEDKSIDFLITGCIYFEYRTLPRDENDRKLFPLSDCGIAQGNSLSPLFADVYLKSFDIEMKRLGIKIVRYVDDFIVFSKTKRERYDNYRKINKYLKKLDLKIGQYNNKDEKCQAGCIKDKIEFLGIEIQPNGSFIIIPKRDHQFKLKIGGEIRKIKTNNIEDKVKLINGLINGWVGAYSMCDKKFLEAHYNKLNAIIEREVNIIQNKIASANRPILKKILRFNFTDKKYRSAKRTKGGSIRVKPGKGQAIFIKNVGPY
ncbi:MAG: hypothetical protein A2744_03080 [Candidatus Buchananbacteria bacterium RIFCSPHIGHO2_01_FULL_44_11]|uniref:Reverse transcriptase domain-containing protein n=1 Tax=Candidatus Buchananbacteria bacterium RIFCSPHIGHO2_01_FULL_44_11 TaxID=1797535 RepID=A0A1G1XZW3_9BACT|nr:MAG: hypothetical protein A2744_03080 [Candidatus Buchananbacteria bacterium RIFCSPHIGHO2_01_FULL_44_11]